MTAFYSLTRCPTPAHFRRRRLLCRGAWSLMLEGDYTYPDDYPELGTEITVIGEFSVL